MEKQGAAKPGLLVLTTGLSKPFRRLDKYAAILQELERHMESGHPDRGDTQRSIAVYKDLAVGILLIRSNLIYLFHTLISVIMFSNSTPKRIRITNFNGTSTRMARARIELTGRY